MQAKWGPRPEGQPPCKIEVKEPITGNMTLPQRPFGNLAYLQRFWVQEDPYFGGVPILAGLGREQEFLEESGDATPKPGAKKAAAAAKRAAKSAAAAAKRAAKSATAAAKRAASELAGELTASCIDHASFRIDEVRLVRILRSMFEAAT